MNKLFRNIKENNNLDLLEESDSEDEFENIQLDKYVKDINPQLSIHNFYRHACKSQQVIVIKIIRKSKKDI